MNKKEIKNYAKEHNCSIREAQRQLGVAPTGKFNDSVEKEDGLKKVKLSEIKTPTTVEEFRDNLKKYFGGFGTDSLYVRNESKDAHGISYTSINSFADIYTLTGTGFGGDGSSPMVVPLIDFDMNDVEEYMRGKDLFFSDGYFNDDYKVYENELGILMKMQSASWCTLDNQILREFYMKVCGEFSGYALSEMSEVA